MNIKRLLMIGGYPYVAGSASTNFVVTFVKGYAQLGIDVRLLLRMFPGQDPPIIDGVKVFTIPVLSLYERLRRLDYFQNEKATVNFINNNYVDGETVIQHYGSPQYGWLFRPKYPIFHTIGEIPTTRSQSSLRNRFRQWGCKYSNKMAKGLLVQTSNLKEFFTNYGIKNIQVYNILIDPARFEDISESKDNNYISYCGCVGLYKDGVGDLIDAFRVIHEYFPVVKLRIIGGFFSIHDETILKNKVNEYNLKNSVVFTGHVSPDKMPGLLFNSRVLVLARPNNIQAKYGFPSKLGEYLFTGRPVVITRVGEIDHFLTDKKSCLFAIPNNPNDFAKKVMWVLDHTEEADVIGKNGKKIAEKHFSMQSQCKVALDFFRNTLSSPSDNA